MKDDNNEQSANKITLGSKKLNTFFIDHLNRIYSAKVHLIERLPLLYNEAHFSDLQSAIAHTLENVEKQIARMELIYALLDKDVAPVNVVGLASLVDDAFEAIQHQNDDAELRDLSILFYLQNIESVEMASFQILQMAAVKIKNHQVAQLLKENYQEAKADRTLFMLISTKYLNN